MSTKWTNICYVGNLSHMNDAYTFEYEKSILWMGYMASPAKYNKCE